MDITQDMTVGGHVFFPQIVPIQYQQLLSVMRRIFYSGFTEKRVVWVYIYIFIYLASMSPLRAQYRWVIFLSRGIG